MIPNSRDRRRRYHRNKKMNANKVPDPVNTGHVDDGFIEATTKPFIDVSDSAVSAFLYFSFWRLMVLPYFCFQFEKYAYNCIHYHHL